MKEGWGEDDYLIVFDEAESKAATAAYALAKFLPGHSVVAIIRWDDFIVRNESGDLFQVPTIPLVQKYLAKLDRFPEAASLEPDDRFTGKIKWYVKPIVFGGGPSSEDNIHRVGLTTHQELVCWWNEKYREVTSKTA